jgi:hypothetical protein
MHALAGDKNLRHCSIYGRESRPPRQCQVFATHRFSLSLPLGTLADNWRVHRRLLSLSPPLIASFPVIFSLTPQRTWAANNEPTNERERAQLALIYRGTAVQFLSQPTS